MNWENKTWKSEDEEFIPKRKVNNRGSRNRPHIIGGFYSQKMQRVVEFESLNERLFYYILELDSATKRYYVQPIAIEIPFIDEEGNKKSWAHYSDILVFRQGSIPNLIQIKERADENYEGSKQEIIDKVCRKYAEKRGWNYSVIYPKQLHPILQRNIKFLIGFLKSRRGFDALIPKVKDKLKELGKSTVIDLAVSFENELNPFWVIPCIYHLIAIGVFKTDLLSEISQYSDVSICDDIKLELTIGGVINYEV